MARPGNGSDRIYVAGHRGLLGSAVVRRLRARGHDGIVTASHADLDLRDQRAVMEFLATERPESIVLCAGRVGGIQANRTEPAQFLYDNLMIAANVLHAAYLHGVAKVLNVGSSCIYPAACPQPMRPEHLLSGPLEVTNEAYAVAKIAAIKLCEAYRSQYGCRFVSVMPTNLYGPNDNFDLERSHVLPALIRKFHQAKVAGRSPVVVWGSGRPRREFLHADDCAEACLLLLDRYEGSAVVNVGAGEDLTVAELADLVRAVVHPTAEVVFDPSHPDGTRQKLLDSSHLRGLGWRPRIGLREGIAETYTWFVESVAAGHKGTPGGLTVG